jgi:TonB family protein
MARKAPAPQGSVIMFRRLIELHSRSAAARASAQGYAVSLAAHLAVLGSALLGGRGARVQSPPDESFTPVQYLIPKERIEESRPQREQITWMSVDTKLAPGFAPAKDAPKDPDRLKVVVAKGEQDDVERGEAAPAPQPPIALGDSIMTELEVDSAVTRYEDSAAPPYPEALLRKHIEGSVLVQYVVDTLGHADTSTFRVLSATHAEFARSVRSTLPLMRFRPAVMANRHVPQLVQQPFVFKILDTVRVARDAGKPPL